MKKTIYLPIEIKTRELYGHLFLAYTASQKGYRVILGNKSGIFKIINKKPNKSGILIYKGGGKKPKFILDLKNKIDYLAILDQELGVAVRDFEFFLRARWDPQVIPHVDRFYLLSDQIADEIKKYTSITHGQSLVTGWPRVDLWMKSEIWMREAQNLRSKYGRYVLFSSDFGTNSNLEVNERAKRATKWTHLKEKKRFEDQLQLNQGRFDEFTKFVKIVKEISQHPDAPHLVIRPHYAENYKAWEDALKGVTNVTIKVEGPISPWLIGSEGLIHAGCTTGFEAQLLNKKSAYFRDTAQTAVGTYTIEHATCLNDVNDYLRWVKDADDRTPVQIDPYKVSIEPKLSVDRILDDISKANVEMEKFPNKPTVSNLVKLGRRFPKFMRDAYRVIMFMIKNPGLRPLANYEQKMQGGISTSDCINFLKRSSLNLEDISIIRLEKDLIVIEKK